MLYSPQRVIKDTNKAIAHILTGDLPILKKIAAYVVESGGKRIRPLFLYYLGNAYGIDKHQELIALGALLEIVHATSLLHDDVIDGAEERRNRPTGAKLFGNKEVILAGDHLLASGIRRLNQMNNPAYMAIFTDAIQALTTAELLQMQQRYDLKTTRVQHRRVIDGKTASLFRAAGALVAAMQDSGEHSYYDTPMADLGLNLGRFFQHRDDHLDYFDAGQLKKGGMQDFLNGIVTEPLLLLLSKVNRAERSAIRSEWEYARTKAKIHDKNQILALMHKYAIERQSRVILLQMQEKILSEIDRLPQGDARKVIKNEFEKILAVRAH